MTWDRRLYFPSEGRRAEDFFDYSHYLSFLVEQEMEEPALVVIHQGLRLTLYSRPNWVGSSLSLYYLKTDADPVYKMLWVFNLG